MAGRADRNLEKERIWRQVVKGHAGSGLSIRQYCTDRGVSQPSFFAWRRELARRDAAADKPATPSHKRAKPKASSLQPATERFAQVQIAPAELVGGTGIEIVLSSGARVRVPPGGAPAESAVGSPVRVSLEARRSGEDFVLEHAGLRAVVHAAGARDIPFPDRQCGSRGNLLDDFVD